MSLDRVPGEAELYMGGCVSRSEESFASAHLVRRPSNTTHQRAADRIRDNRLFSLRRHEALKKAKITHVVSALRLPLDQDLFKGFKHHVVEIDDVEEENIIQYFAASNVFITEGLESGGGVLLHW